MEAVWENDEWKKKQFNIGEIWIAEDNTKICPICNSYKVVLSNYDDENVHLNCENCNELIYMQIVWFMLLFNKLESH